MHRAKGRDPSNCGVLLWSCLEVYIREGGVRRDTPTGDGLSGAPQHVELEMISGQYHSMIIRTVVLIPKMRDRI